MNMTKLFLALFFAVLFVPVSPIAQEKNATEIRTLIETFKNDVRGPYKDIRWFCVDGSIIPPKADCPKPGGVQHARYKDEVVALGETNHIFLGQILASTSRTEFWDEANNHSRLKQYQLDRYLQSADDGWIMRKGQFYRGALQIEDEEDWGIRFFELILKDTTKTNRHFFLIREAAKDIPHGIENDRTQKIRALSKVLSEKYQPFFDLRVKMHGQPDATDLETVRDFLSMHEEKMSNRTIAQFEELITEMDVEYQPVQRGSLKKYANALHPKSRLRNSLNSLIYNYENEVASPEKLMLIAQLLKDTRMALPKMDKSETRLAAMDLSINLEKIFIREISTWDPQNLNQLLDKAYYSAMAAMGCGYLEIWEWQKISAYLNSLTKEEQINLSDLIRIHHQIRNIVELGVGMNNAVYKEVVDLYGEFEPLAYGFLDNKTRSSLLLPLGKTASVLGDFIADRAHFSNDVMGIPHQSGIRGLNPGYALGELVVVDDPYEKIDFSDDKIYVIGKTTADLNPVAGIASVSEGNLVSHVQLLARNLGIPNAVLTHDNLMELKKYSGTKVFYAVSEKGTVIMKPASEMTRRERGLFKTKNRKDQKVRIPTKNINLQEQRVLNLNNIRANDSGKICGPKAANLGQLKAQFPDMVVDGIVIPFGIFREHMNQQFPQSKMTYWDFLTRIFRIAETIPNKSAAEDYIFQELSLLRNAILEMPLDQAFIDELKLQFQAVLGSEIGTIPVFVRSDTNMEDLKDFTGSGLNLTLFNVIEENEIIHGIRQVWASPFKERSYKWRQKYLLNPENVYPSILIIPSVNVDYSGVLITKGVTTNNASDLTIAFSRGAGGAVDGQAAESYLLKASGDNILLSPAREPRYRIIPPTGGSYKATTTFERPILKQKNLNSLRTLAAEVKRVMPYTPGIEADGPFDIELGFKDDQIWLFQIRPFVENKNAKKSAYLKDISPRLPLYDPIDISTPL